MQEKKRVMCQFIAIYCRFNFNALMKCRTNILELFFLYCSEKLSVAINFNCRKFLDATFTI